MSYKGKPEDEAEKACRAILDAIDRIEDFTRGYSKAAFEADQKTISAVCYEFIALGERVYELQKQKFFDDSPFDERVSWSAVANMRHFLAHEYYSHIDTGILWETIQSNLADLKEATAWHLAEAKR